MADSLVQSASGTGSSVSPAATWGGTTVAGNTLVAMVSSFGNGTKALTAPAGWTLLKLLDGTLNTGQFAFYYILASAARSGAETWTSTSTGTWAVSLAEYSGMGANVTLDSTSFTIVSSGALSTIIGTEAVTNGAHTLAVLMLGHTLNATVTDGASANPGPFNFTSVVEPKRNVSTHAHHQHLYKFFTDYDIPHEAKQINTASGGAHFYVAIMAVFRDAVASTPPSNGAAGGSATEVQRISSASAAGVGGNTLVLNLGSNPAVGNLQVIAVASTKGSALTGVVTPAGWTLAKMVGGERSWSINVSQLVVFYKISAGAGDKSVTVDFQESILRAGFSVEFTGTSNLLNQSAGLPVATVAPMETMGSISNETDSAFSSGLTPSAAPGMWVGFSSSFVAAGITDLDGGFTSISSVASGSWTLRYWNKATSASGRGRLVINGQAGSDENSLVICCFGVAGSDHWAWAEGSDAVDSWAYMT